MRVSSPISMSIAALAVFSITSCNDAPSAVSHESLHDAAQLRAMAATSSSLSPTTAQLVKKLHAATARYHSQDQATAAGYEVASPCVAVPGLGGMGFHWVDNGEVDPVYNPMVPEAVLYAPNADGELKLVAVEFIVINVGQARPSFGDQLFDIGGTPIPVPHWSLHVWLHKDNPSGIFAPFNPDVVCPS